MQAKHLRGKASGFGRPIIFTATLMAALELSAMIGCGKSTSSPGEGSTGTGAMACVPGKSEVCAGPNGCTGFQVCSDQGDRLGPCSCSGTATGSTSTTTAGGEDAASGGTGSTTTGPTGMMDGAGGSGSGSGGAGPGGAGPGGAGTGGSAGAGGSGATADSGALACVAAKGMDGSISDFSNQAISHAGDGRTSENWQVYNIRVAGMDRMSIETDGGNFYLHCVLNDLDASCGVPMNKACYDASAYSGIELRFKEGAAFTGKAILAIRTLATIPRAEGGNCDLGLFCNDSFHVDLNVPLAWTSLQLPWSMFTQKGFGFAPVGYVPQREIVSIVIAPQVGTGVDIDLDDLGFY